MCSSACQENSIEKVFLRKNRIRARFLRRLAKTTSCSGAVALIDGYRSGRCENSNCFLRVNNRIFRRANYCAAGALRSEFRSYHGLFVRIQTLHEPRVVQRRLFRWTHSLQRVQLGVDRLPPLRRHPLPFRQQFVSDIVALLGREFPICSPVPSSILLFRRKIVPFLEILANLMLPPRRQILESLIVLHEALLLFRRLVAQILDPFRRRPFHAARVGSPIRALFACAFAAAAARSPREFSAAPAALGAFHSDAASFGRVPPELASPRRRLLPGCGLPSTPLFRGLFLRATCSFCRLRLRSLIARI